jgi:hypothetical protein
MAIRSNNRLYLLISGDIVAFAIVTIVGFASHGTADTAGARMLTTFLPLSAAWLLIAPLLKVYDFGIINDGRQLWRPFWAMVLAAPMAGWLRGLMLNSPILPLFVIILGGVGALTILAWRGLYWILSTRLLSSDG